MINYKNYKLFVFIRKFLKSFIRFIAYQIRNLLNLSNERLVYIFLESLRSSSQSNKKSKLLTEFKIYPKNPKRIYPIYNETNNLTVIIQGPIYDREFVQGTIDWYTACGISKIIVSTSQKTRDFKKATTIIYEQPNKKGLFQENNHLLSIQKALEITNDDDIVIKTRTDMRIFNELALLAIPSIHKNYKSNITNDGYRLGVVSNNSILLKINNISDHLYIGSAKLLKKMFSLEFREINKVLSEINVNPNLLIKEKRGIYLKTTLTTSTFTEYFAEQWFFNSFRKNCLKKDMSEKRIMEFKNYKKGVSEYLDIIKNSLYVIDPEELDLYWLKQNISTLPSYFQDADQNDEPIPCIRLTRLNWLNLLQDKTFKDKVLKYLDSIDKDKLLY